MFKLNARLLATAAVALIGVFVIIAYTVAAPAGRSQTARVEMLNVSRQQLNEKGIDLFEPDAAAKPATREESARMVATRDGGTVAETRLARLVVKRTDPPIDTLAWIVALDPASFTPPQFGASENAEWDKEHPDWKRGAIRTVYALSLIDANTGEEISFVSQAEVPYQTPAPKTN